MPTRWTRIIILMALAVLGVLLLLSTNTEAKTIEVDIAGGGHYTSIQDGVNASEDGDTVFIRGGEYHEEVNIPTSITLKGMDDRTSVLTSANDTVALSIGVANVTVRDLVFRNANSGIQIFQSLGVVIENCTFDACRMGISLIASSRVRILHNTFQHNTYTGVIFFQWKETDVCTGNTLSGNVFERNANGLIVYVMCTDLDVHNNAFRNNTDSGITCLAQKEFAVNATDNWWGSTFGPYSYEENPYGRGDTVIGPVTFDPWIGKEDMPLPMNLSTAYVLSSVTENGDGSQQKPFDSIIQAIFHIQSNGTIHVWEGTYLEHLVIKKSMKIIGNISENSILESGVFAECVVILADHVVIRNLMIQVITNETRSQESFGHRPDRNSCILIKSSHNIIADCVLKNGAVGIYLSSSSNNMILSNTLHPDSHPSFGNGIVLADGSNDNQIIKNNCINFNEHGISIRSSEDNILEKNNCTKSEIGISLSGCKATVLNGNDCSNNSEIGIRVQNSSHLIVSNNVCDNNGDVGIELDRGTGEGDRCEWNELTSNDCSENGLAGIDLGDSSRSVLRMNSMWGNGITLESMPLNVQEEHDIDTTNMVNGNPMYYLVNRTGIRLDGGAGQVILVNCSETVIENQRFDACSIGIALYYSTSITISFCDFTDNIFGILMHNSDNNLLSHSTLSDNNRDMISGGLAAIYSHNNTITHNLISGNDLVGLGFVLSSNNVISNNTIVENGYGIIFLSDQGLLKYFQAHLEVDFSLYGINRVHYNAINGNALYGISADEISYQQTLYFDILQIDDDYPYSVDARYNWWGSDHGPEASKSWRNPGGNGDKVSDHVEFSPWITEDGSLRYAKSGDDDGLLDILHPLDLLFLLLVVLVLLFASLVLVVRSKDERFKRK